MKRIVVLLTVVALMMAMSVVPALAQEPPPNFRALLPDQPCNTPAEEHSLIIEESGRIPPECGLHLNPGNPTP
jgi:hypothetical protein